VGSEMALSDNRLRQWQNRRAARLNGLSWLAQETPTGGEPAWFVKDELLVLDEHGARAERLLGRGAHGSQLAPGVVRYRADGLDVPSLARAVRRSAKQDGDKRLVAAPNHVFVSAPFEHGGPFGPPVPAVAPLTRRDNTVVGQVPVAVVDTGIWRDSPLPEASYIAFAEDYQADTDVDNDGVMDGDVGHANFIVGVIAHNTGAARVRAIRLLDTFGVCTEADLVLALSRLESDVRLVNLSLGGFTLDNQPPLALAQAMSNLVARQECLVVCAAGNNGQRGVPFWPAAFAGTGQDWADRVVAVAAHDGRAICDWSNSGEWVTLAAPGADITSTFVRHDLFPSGWALWSGTSFATPYVVASLAERLAKGDTVDSALQAVLVAAKIRTFDGYPSLP
jgi:thermitase